MVKNYIFVLLLTLLYARTTFAQSAQKNFINYQGVARNAENQLMANEGMTIGIALNFGASNATTAYEEQHTLTTDANGVFSLKIGDGSPMAGDYDTLSWGQEAVYLTTSLNGKIIGTTEMMAVPYAISSGNADDQSATEVPYNNAVSGLMATNTQEAIDELVGDGAIDADADPTNEIQTISFDAVSNEISLTDGGTITIPSGGTDADADPTNEIQTISFDATTNELSLTEGGVVIIPGAGADADADPSNEFQTLNFDSATNELSLTDGNTVTIPSGGADADADPTNEIDVTAQSGLLMGDGAVMTGLVGTTDGQVAKWDAASSTWVAGTDATGGGGDASSGLEALDEGNGFGWRLKGREPDNYGPIGSRAVDFSYSPDGGNYGASGVTSIAMGYSTKASGKNSTAMGDFTKASGETSTVMGYNTTASGATSTAMGIGTKAESYISTAIGRYNIGGFTDNTGTNNDGDTDWIAEDPLFEIGNGTSSSRNNALTVLKNGNMGIGIAAPVAKLDVKGDIRSSDLSGIGQRNVMADTDGSLIIGTGGGGSSLWTENGSDIHYDTGNVGIGGQNPSGKLHVLHNSSTISPHLKLEESETDYARLEFKTKAPGFWNIAARGGTSGNVSRLNFYFSDGTAPGRDYMTISGSGNVGVGTTSPVSKLDVAGKIRSKELSGAGERSVMADADGNLVIGTDITRKSNYFQSGSLFDEVEAEFTSIPIGPPLIIEKEYAESRIEVTVNSSAWMYTPSRVIDPGDGSIYATRFQVRIDGRVADFGNDGLLELNYGHDFLSIFNVFEGLSAGNHTIQIYVGFLFRSGTVTVRLDPKDLGGRMIAKETF